MDRNTRLISSSARQIRHYLQLCLVFSAFLLWGCGTAPYEVLETDVSIEAIPEGIAVDRATGAIYLSSINEDRIYRLGPNGRGATPIHTRSDNGYSLGLGLEINGKTLYALSALNRSPRSILTRYDLVTGTFTTHTHSDRDTAQFNDLAVTRQGDAFITDSRQHRLYRYNHKTDSIRVFLEGDTFRYPNGICLNEDETVLFVSSLTHGIRLVDPVRGTLLNDSEPQTLGGGIDGMKFHKGSLVFVMNRLVDGALVSGLYRLPYRERSRDFGPLDTLLEDPVAFPVPTTLAIVQDTLYALADSQLDHYDDSVQSIKEPQALVPVRVIKFPLH